MAYLKRPQKGERVLQSLFDSVNSIIDYLPSITVRGDNYSTFVQHSTAGTVIHAKPAIDTDQNSGGKTYAAGSGLHLSGNIFSNALSGDGSTIAINNNIISCLVSPSGGGPDTNTTYIGELNADCQCGWIFVDDTPISGDTYVIRSNLRYIGQLYNYPLSSNVQSPEYYHFLQQGDLKDGAGTTVTYHRSSAGNHQGDDPEAPLITWVDGIQVDVAMSGGRYMSPTFYKGVGYGDYSSAYVDCLLSGDNSHIFITDQAPNPDGSYGGIISTNIHGDGTTVTMDADGTLHAVGGGGGGGCPWPIWQNLAGSANIVWPLTRYSQTNGGWLRISYKGYGGCYGVWIEDNYIGLGGGPDTWTLPIPPNSSFYIEVPSGADSMCWFDNTTTPAKVTTELIEYWRNTSAGVSDVMYYANSAVNEMKEASYSRNGARNVYSTMSADWQNYLDHMFDEYPEEPASLQYYADWKQQISDYAVSARQHANSATSASEEVITLNNALGQYKSDMMDYQANEYEQKADGYATEAENYSTSAVTIYGYAETYWQQHPQE